MKVAIATYSTAQNYGALLQGHALQKYITELGNSCDLLWVDKPDERWFKPRKEIQDIVFSLLLMKQGKKRIVQYKAFRKEFLQYSKQIKNGEELSKINDEYEAFVTGSDQVWNCLGRLNPIYYLLFVDEQKLKIAYAPSFGKPVIPEELKESVIKALKRFDYISVREKSGVKLLERLMGNSPQLVVDPVFLYGKSYWKQIAAEVEHKNKYMFVYTTQKSQKLNCAVKQISKQLGLEVVTTHAIPGCKCTVKKNIGPLEFLRYLMDAEYIVSTSFHATAFSIIFEKNFCVIPHDTTGARVVDILEDTDLSQCLWLDDNYKVTNIDYTTSGTGRLEERVAMSKEYLVQALARS